LGAVLLLIGRINASAYPRRYVNKSTRGARLPRPPEARSPLFVGLRERRTSSRLSAVSWSSRGHRNRCRVDGRNETETVLSERDHHRPETL